MRILLYIGTPLALFLVLVILRSASGDMGASHYKVTKAVDSDNLNKLFIISEPSAYISGLGSCDSLSEYAAINSDCLHAGSATYRLARLENRCVGCMGRSRIEDRKIRVHYRPNTKLQVIDAYLVVREDDSAKLLNKKPIEYLLLIDSDGNQIESPAHVVASAKSANKSESEYIRSKQNSTHIVRQFCFNEATGSDPHKKVSQFIDDFQLDGEVTIRKQPCRSPGKSDKPGFVIVTDEADSYITFDYYRRDWRIHGRWL